MENKLALVPEKYTILKQPNLISLMSCDFSALQIRILISIIEKLQKEIELSINGKTTEQLNLFDTKNNSIVLNIQIKNFGVSPNNYSQLKRALAKVATIPVQLDAKDPISGAESWKIQGLFKAYIPKQKYAREISVEIEKEIAKKLIETDKGFTKFIKEVAFSTTNKYTIRLYILISSWKDKGGFSIKYQKLRNWLDIGDAYKDFYDFKKRVISPAYKHLKKRADVWFEISEILKNENGEVHKLNFKVIKEIVSEKEKEILQRNKKLLYNHWRNDFKMSNEQIDIILKDFSSSKMGVLVSKTIDLRSYIEINHKNITNIPNYAFEALKKI